MTDFQKLISSVENEKLAEVNITSQLLEELCKYGKLVIVRELDLLECRWVLRIAAQNTAGLTWPLPAAKD